MAFGQPQIILILILISREDPYSHHTPRSVSDPFLAPMSLSLPSSCVTPRLLFRMFAPR